MVSTTFGIRNLNQTEWRAGIDSSTVTQGFAVLL